MIKMEYLAAEQVRQIEIHKWIESERAHYDLAENACFDWVAKYASKFRAWANTIPEHCTECGRCVPDSTECPTPFDPQRISLWEAAQMKRT